VQRSSETIEQIAGALAKAQAELTNPEKALIATIRASRNAADGGERDGDQSRCPHARERPASGSDLALAGETYP
jgi:hypothetical protein